jgi:hypothetical protein
MKLGGPQSQAGYYREIKMYVVLVRISNPDHPLQSLVTVLLFPFNTASYQNHY